MTTTSTAASSAPLTVTVRDKEYVIDGLSSTATRICYRSVRNGRGFGPVRFAHGDGRPGTVARAIWDAATEV